MEPSRPSPALNAIVAGWSALAIAWITVPAVVLYIVTDRPRYVQLFRDFKLDPPAMTHVWLGLPDPALWLGAALLVGASSAAQWVRRRQGGAASVHLVVILLAVIAFALYRDGLLRSFDGILWHVSGPAKR